MTAKQYAARDALALDKAGGYHMRHRMAMTTEGLHSKGDIADELAWRDMEIDRLRLELRAQEALHHSKTLCPSCLRHVEATR